jgi:tRNA pseudouridine38/39 synthase
MDKKPEYKRWTKEALIKRLEKLDAERETDPNAPSSPPAAVGLSSIASPDSSPIPLPGTASPVPVRSLKPSKRATDRRIDPSKYATRLVAFKLAYVGKNYGGFEFQASGVLPTIEEELWKAFVKSCLIFPEDPEVVRWEEWDYSKCGRTDRGVSAFGQVIACRVRSNRPLSEKEKKSAAPKEGENVSVVEGQAADSAVEDGGETVELFEEEEKPFDDFQDEIQYCRILNRLLPPDIKVLAWCPTTPPKFSARHDCRERQYRYFFTQPAYSPVPHILENPKATPRVKDGWLDIDAMRTAAKKFEGTHDFRNFCKVDPSKLITNFDRRIFECDIVEVKDAESALPYLDREDLRPSYPSIGTDVKLPKVYYFHVRGSAFLWHQIRCMVAAIFMVGQGLEDAAIIDQLLDHKSQPQRPNYVLASEFPLVLWDCVFPQEGDPQRKDIVSNAGTIFNISSLSEEQTSFY